MVNRSRYGFAPIILLLLVALLAGGGYYVYKNFNVNLTPKITTPTSSPVSTSTPSSTADWKTYSGAKFSFNYPANFSIEETQGGLILNLTLDDIVKNLIITVEPTSTHDFYQDKKKSDELQINSIKWDYLSGYATYCDAGRCADLSDILRTTNQSSRYTVILGNLFYTDSEITQILSTFKFTEQVNNNVSEMKKVLSNYLKAKGSDLSKVTIGEPQKLGNLADVYSLSWGETGYVGGGLYVLIGKKNNQWIIPDSGDATYCGWIKTSGVDEATKAFMGPTCK